MRHRNRVADDDVIAIDEDFFDHETQDFLSLGDVEGSGGRAQPG